MLNQCSSIKSIGDQAEPPFSHLLSGTNLAQPLINPRPPSENHSARRHEVGAAGENTGGGAISKLTRSSEHSSLTDRMRLE
jgi:hypothetical protein